MPNRRGFSVFFFDERGYIGILQGYVSYELNCLNGVIYIYTYGYIGDYYRGVLGV